MRMVNKINQMPRCFWAMPWLSDADVVLCPGYLLSGVPDYFDRNKISSGGDLSHYSSASLY